MNGGDRLVSTLGTPRTITGIGLCYVAIALVQPISGPIAEVVIDFVLFATTGIALVYGGYWLSRSDVHVDEYPRVIAWCLGGFALLLGVLAIIVFSPSIGVDDPLWGAGIATAFGAVGGLGIGLKDASVRSRTREVERRNQELRWYETLSEESTDVNAVMDVDGRFQYLTPSVERVLGYEPDELVGDLAFEYMHPDDREGAMEGFAEAIERGRGGPVEFRFQHKDGSWVVLEGRGRNLLDDPAIEGVVAYTHDVTERAERERELGKYKTLTETASDVIVTIDDRSVIRSVNPSVEDVFGYERSDVLGEPLTMLMPESIRRRHENGLQRYLETRERTLDWEYVELRGLHRDGHEVPLAVSFSEHEHGGEQLFTGIIRDVTERKRLEDDLRSERDLRERVVETSPVGIAVLDDAGTVTFLNDRGERLLGRTREELNERVEGQTIFDAADATDVEASGTVTEVETSADATHEGSPSDATSVRVAPYQRVLDGEDPIFGLELQFTRSDGAPTWVSVNGAPILDEGGELTRVVLAFEDLTERKRHQQRLVLLNELSRDLTDAQSKAAVADLAVEVARETLGLPLVAVDFYDEAEGRLRPATRTEAVTRLVDDRRLFEGERDLAWQAFVDQSEVVDDDLSDWADDDLSDRADALAPGGELRSVMIFPLGDHGVITIGSTTANAFSDTDVSLANMLVATTRSALDRVARERTLRDRKNTLEEKNAVLQRLQRINDTIRGITTELIRASTREEIVQAVCDQLTETETYRLAWIGSHDAVTDEVVPEVWAGDDVDYLESITVMADDDGGPTGEAVQTGKTQVRNELASDPPFDPWQQAAIERGYKAVIAVPLVYQDSHHGVLSLFATQSGGFDRMERAVLTELGETIGYALNALDRKRALVSDESVELEFKVRKGTPPLFQFAAEHDCEFEFENVVQRADGLPGIFVTIRGASVDEVLEFGERSPEIAEMILVSDRDGDALFECQLRDSAFFSALLDRGAMPQTFTATGEEGHAVVRVPRTSNVRTFVELFEARYEECELVGRRQVDRPIKTQQEFQTEIRTRLTERQSEILHTAYVSGFFEWPREITAQELAEALEVSQPTVSRHIRAGERTLFGLVFDE